jgi:PAS domain S-box-containing protein
VIDFYQQLFDGIPSWVTVQDRSLRIIAANQVFRDDFGQGVGSPCYQVVKGRTCKCEVCPVEKTFQDGAVHSSEEVVRPGGQPRNVIVHTSPILGPDGAIRAVLEIFTDITEVKLIQEKYRTLFDEVPCYISVQDPRLRVVETNRLFKKDFGVETGGRCYEIYKHRTEPCEVCPVAQVFQDGEVHESEEVVTPLHGRPQHVLVSAAPIRDASGEITTVMEMSRNITRLRELQSQLASLGLIVSSVSHGLKGLLSGLDGGLYLMESGFAKDKMDRVQQGLQMTRRNVDAIRSAVTNVLYYSKDREISWETLVLEEVVEKVGAMLAGRAAMLGIELRAEARAGTLEGDAHAIPSLLVNLVENAIDACRLDKRPQAHEVLLSGSVEGNRARFVVQDNGIGMDRETRERAFSIFFSSKGAEGTGLGLFIANKIARSHGGSIDLESTVGVGTRFIVTLPRTKCIPEGGVIGEGPPRDPCGGVERGAEG